MGERRRLDLPDTPAVLGMKRFNCEILPTDALTVERNLHTEELGGAVLIRFLHAGRLVGGVGFSLAGALDFAAYVGALAMAGKEPTPKQIATRRKFLAAAKKLNASRRPVP
jgi:hypothetical protein